MKYFVTSDIHSFYTPFKKALDNASFNEQDNNHMLIVCGDCFDRGNETMQVLEYLEHLQKLNKVILVRGNHEDLLQEALRRGTFLTTDKHNGTDKTAIALSGFKFKYDYLAMDGAYAATKRIQPFLDSMVNYYETEHYIFVHSWIPITYDHNGLKSPYDVLCAEKIYDRNWRHEEDWEEARWCNPFIMASKNLNKTNKTIVFGHWHTFYYRQMKDQIKVTLNYDNLKPEDFAPVFDTEWKIIGLDACTALSNLSNVLVLED